MGGSGGGLARANQEAGQQQANAARNVGNLQSDTVLTTSEMRARAIEQAGLLGSQNSGINLSGVIEDRQIAGDEALQFQRDAFDQATELLNPFTTVGDQSLQALEEGATTEGFAKRLTDIMDGAAFQGLRDERLRASDSAASARGLNRSGSAIQAASDISTSTAMGLDSELMRRQMANVNIDMQASNQLARFSKGFADSSGQITLGTANDVGNLRARQAASAAAAGSANRSAMARSIMGAANARADGLDQSAFFLGSGEMGAVNATSNALIGSEQARADARQNRFNNILGAAQVGASIFASDESLKKNMKKIGKIADLTWYEWDWRDEYKGAFGCEMMTGFGASEVQQKYPDCVHEIEGIKAIDYPLLHDKLQVKLQTEVAA